MNATLKKQKYLSLALLIVFILCLFVLVDDLILKRFKTYQQSINQSKSQIVRFEALLKQQSQIETRANEINKDASLKDQLLPEIDKRQAEANLQSRLKGLIEKHGGLVNSIQILPEPRANEENELTKVSVKTQAMLKPESYESLLRAIEEEKPFLFIDLLRLNIRQTIIRQPKQTSKETNATANKPIMQIDYGVELTISGYLKTQTE